MLVMLLWKRGFFPRPEVVIGTPLMCVLFDRMWKLINVIKLQNLQYIMERLETQIFLVMPLGGSWCLNLPAVVEVTITPRKNVCSGATRWLVGLGKVYRAHCLHSYLMDCKKTVNMFLA